MLISRKQHTPSKIFRHILLRRFRSKAAVHLVAVSCALAPCSVLANELINSHNGVFSSKFELNQWPDYSTLPYAAAERLSKQRVQTLAEEASKRAQTQYLAKKFGQHVKIVRQYVDYAWAEAAKRDGIEPELIIAIMQKESSLRPRVQSRFGAQGLMQVIRKWHGEKLRPSESLFDPEVNIRVGSDILEEYLELAGGSLPKALKKYSGNARGYSNTVLKESRKLALVAEQAAGG
ncbi:transglycosylase SLT domain-containing protein [Alcaligenaceae bacterium]|nr:transglycosylase SLT domain-containing protein [Alcaligenaceae bacterium]